VNNYVQRGETLTVVAPYAVSSGGGVQVSNIFGIAVATQALNDNMEILTYGVFDLAKDASTFAQGDPVFWDNVNNVATSIASGPLHIGETVITTPSGTNALGAASGDATVRVRLNGTFGVALSAASRIAHFLYSFAVDGGASCTPSKSDTIPANAVVFGGTINSATAVTAAGAATVSVGTTAGSGAASILAATAKASLSLDAVLVTTAAATPFKMSAAGQISITVATGPLTAGVIEGWALYVEADEG